MTGNIQLSVVIACYNGAATLGDQLAALAAQPCPVPWELIVADNGSTDDSLEVARRFADHLPLRVVRASARRGPAHARNCGVLAAQGEWIAFCDADDIVAPTWLAAVSSVMARHEFVAGRVDVDLLNPPRVSRSRRLEQQADLQPAGGNRLGLPHAGAGNMAVHRRVFLAVGGFDEGLTALEDTDLCWRIQLAGTPLAFAPEMLIHTRLRATLSGNARQGYAYGRGHTLLEARHGLLAPDHPPILDGHAGTGPPTSASPPRRPLASALRSARTLRTVPTVRGVLWQVAWHLGRHAALRTQGASVAVPSPRELPPAPEAAPAPRCESVMGGASARPERA